MEDVEKRWLVALLATWSSDYWREINHDDAARRQPDRGPDGAEVILSIMFDGMPDEQAIHKALQASERALAACEGRHRLQSYALLDMAQWQALAGQEAATLEDEMKHTPSPPFVWYTDCAEAEANMLQIGITLTPTLTRGLV